MSFISRLKLKYQVIAKMPNKIATDINDFIKLERKEFVIDDAHLSLEKRRELIATRKKELEKKEKEIKKDIDKDPNLTEAQREQDKKRFDSHLEHYEKGLDSMLNAKYWRDLDKVPDEEWKKKGLEPKGDKLSSSRRGGIASFAIPAGLTCPKAGSCKNHCFALTGHTAYVQMVRDTHSAALGLSERDDFVQKMNEVIGKKFKNKPLDPSNPYRIHAWGDFYSNKYAQKWLDIINSNPNVWFYMYTKSFTMPAIQKLMAGIKKGTILNAKVIQSLNGKDDKKIDPKMPIAVVFKSKSDMEAWNNGATSVEESAYDKQKAKRLIELKKEISEKDLPPKLKAEVVPLRKKLKSLKEELKADKSNKATQRKIKALKAELDKKDLTKDQKYDLALLIKEERKLKKQESSDRKKSYENLVNVLSNLKIYPKDGKFEECSDNDLVAANPSIKRIGIVEHGELHQPKGFKMEEVERTITASVYAPNLQNVSCEHMHSC